METGAGVVDGVDSFVKCGRFALGGLAVVCLEENVGVSVEAYVIELESSEATDIIRDVIEKVKFEGA